MQNALFRRAEEEAHGGRMMLSPQAEALVYLAARSIVQPYAVYAFEQDDFEGGSFAMFTIHGGPSDGSSVTAETLRALGMAVPEVKA